MFPSDRVEDDPALWLRLVAKTSTEPPAPMKERPERESSRVACLLSLSITEFQRKDAKNSLNHTAISDSTLLKILCVSVTLRPCVKVADVAGTVPTEAADTHNLQIADHLLIRLRSQAPPGNANSRSCVSRRRYPHKRSRASWHCVPKPSLGTSGDARPCSDALDRDLNFDLADESRFGVGGRLRCAGQFVGQGFGADIVVPLLNRRQDLDVVRCE